MLLRVLVADPREVWPGFRHGHCPDHGPLGKPTVERHEDGSVVVSWACGKHFADVTVNTKKVEGA